MGLKELKFGQRTVRTAGGEIKVRGLSFNDITALVRLHTTEVVMLFEGSQNLEQEVDYGVLVGKLLHTAPKLAHTIIAMGADEPTNDDELKAAAEVVSTFPSGVQLAMLDAIGEETFAVEGGAKKVFEIVTRMMKGASELKNSSQVSTIGSTESA